MKTKIILPLLMVFNCFTMAAIGQDGFINKAEAKNLTVNRLKEGKWIEYDDEMGGFTTDTDAAIQYILTEYKADKPVGVVRYYTMEGGIISETPYVNGKQNGLGKTYYETAELMIEKTWVNDHEEGLEKTYYRNGKLKSTSAFTNGHLGTVTDYDTNGAVIKVTNY